MIQNNGTARISGCYNLGLEDSFVNTGTLYLSDISNFNVSGVVNTGKIVCGNAAPGFAGLSLSRSKGLSRAERGRAVKARLGSVQVETLDGDDQLRLNSAADLLVHSKARIAVLVIPSAQGQSRYVAGIVIQHLVHRLWVARTASVSRSSLMRNHIAVHGE